MAGFVLHWIALDYQMAEGRGIEPQFTGPEPVVLPLDDPSMHKLQTGEPTTYIKKMISRHGAWDESWHIDVNSRSELFCINIAGIYHGALSAFAGSDTDHLFHGIYEDNTVPRFSGVG